DAYRAAVADEPAADDAAPELQSLLRPLDVVSAQRAAVGRREADAGEVEAVRIRAEPSRRGRARGGVLHLFEVRYAAPADIMPAGRIGEVVVAFARDRVPCPLRLRAEQRAGRRASGLVRAALHGEELRKCLESRDVDGEGQFPVADRQRAAGVNAGLPDVMTCHHGVPVDRTVGHVRSLAIVSRAPSPAPTIARE